MTTQASALLMALLRGDGLPLASDQMWEAARQLAEKHGLYPILMVRCREQLPESLVARWRAPMHLLASHNLSLARDEQAIVALLAGAGISVAPLKGVRLAEALYGTVGARTIYDIDILVPDADVEKACELLVQAGWRQLVNSAQSAAHARRMLHHWAFKRDGQHLANITLELHWSLIRSAVLGLPHDLVWSHIRQQSSTQWTLGIELQLVHLALHLFQHNFMPMSRVVDLAVFLERYGGMLDPARLESLGDVRARRLVVALACEVASQAMGQPLPAAVAPWVSGSVRRAARSLPWKSLFDEPLFNYSRYYMLAGLVGGWDILFEQVGRSLFAPYEIELDGPVAHLTHPLRLAGRYGSRLWQHATARTKQAP